MNKLRVYKEAGIIYFENWNTFLTVASPIDTDMEGTVSAVILHNPPEIDKIRFQHTYGYVTIIDYKFDDIVDSSNTPYGTVSAQLTLDAIALALGLSAGSIAGGATAENQELEIEQLQQINENLGNKASEAATSDTGDFSLIALFKRYLQQFAAFFSSFGAKTDAAATADGADTGLISLFKRLLGVGIRLRNAAGTKTLEFGVQAAANSIPVVFGENPKYAASATYSLGGNPTDFFGITGSASKKVKILSCKIYATESQALGGGNIRTMDLVKRSSNSTGGTTTPIVRAPLDSSSSAAAATVVAYTANPTVGVTVAVIGSHQLTHPLSSTISAQYGLELIGAPVILNTAAEGLYLNGKGVSRPNNLYCITIIWEEY